MIMLNYRIIGLLKCLMITVAISGCTQLPPYLEPDPVKEPTAKLRIAVASPGVRAGVSLHKNNDSNKCLIENGAVKMPVHMVNSGVEFGSKKKIGMPLVEPFWDETGSEMYIPATGDITLSASFGGVPSCRVAFRFRPLPEKNYQLLIQGVGWMGGRYGEKVCLYKFQEIVEDVVSKKVIEKEVARTLVIRKPDSVFTSKPADAEADEYWRSFCKDVDS